MLQLDGRTFPRMTPINADQEPSVLIREIRGKSFVAVAVADLC